jgi:hypothetical protein
VQPLSGQLGLAFDLAERALDVQRDRGQPLG